MAPGMKRKRGDRTYSQDNNDGSQRASPHRPQNLSLAQQNQHPNGGARGGRRSSRGGLRGGFPNSQQPRSPGAGPNVMQSPSNAASPTTRTAMSPPPPRDSQSQPTVAAPETRTSTVAETNEPKAQPNAPSYRWDYVTDGRKKNWREAGHNEVVNEAVRLQEAGDDIQLGVVFGELVTAAIRERLTGQEVGSTVKEILQKSGSAESTLLPALFLDNLQITAEVEKSSSPAIGVLLRNSAIPATLIREVLDVDLLQALGFVRSTFGRMGIRVSTNLLYRQSAFNLLREETEGYAKLITEYFTVTGSLSPTKEVVEETYEKIKALIGAFDLDVGRVLDVTLDAFANSIIRHHRFFIKFLRMSCWWPEEKSIPGFEHADQVFDSLPLWADPECTGFDTTPEDKARLSELRTARDVEFWNRVRDVGIKAFFELGGRRAILSTDTQIDETASAPSNDKPGDEGESDLDWTKHTGTYPPRGNATAAQLLGFKLRFYASQARDAQDTLPETLIWLAALLIKIGFISFRDLYPHLYPLDENMDKLKDKLLAAKRARKAKSNIGARPNALQAASALPEGEPPGLTRGVRREVESASTPRPGASGSTPAHAESAADKEELPEPDDQKIHLLKNLLLLGAIPEAMYILGRFPWLLDVYEDLPQYVFRILHYSLQKVAEEVRPLGDRDGLRAPKKLVYDSASTILPKGHLFLVDRPNRKTLKYASLEKSEVDDGYPVDFKFYWDDWADNVPICQNVEDVFTLCGSLLNLVGIKIGADTSLLTKLIRIARRSLDADKSAHNVSRWVDLCKRLLVPALSLSGKNPGVVGEMWLLLKYFPLSTRYNIYSQWHRGPISRNADLMEAFERTRAETRDVLKRMSRTTIRPMARALAKVCCESPTKVFETAINQIESYSNQVEIFVEVCKYVAPMTSDVLTWSLLEALGGDRSRLQGDGMLTSGWLNALSSLVGKAFRTYPHMDPAPILRYIAHQLRRGSSAELEVLIQLIEHMAGIRPDTTWTDEQLLAMSGKETLQAQILKQLGDRRSVVKNSSRRLLRVLVTNNLAGPLLVGIAQMRQLYPHIEEVADAPTKVISSNLTKIYDALIQYLDLLRTNLSVDDFDKAIPALAALIQTHGIDPSIAFTVFRSSIQHHMEQWEKANPTSANLDGPSSPEDRKQKSEQGTEAVNGDVDMTDGHADTESDRPNGTEDAAMKEAEPSDLSDPSPTPNPSTDRALHPVLRDLMGELEGVMPDDFSSNMSLSFYVRFWQASLYDMIVPPYATEIKKVEAALARIALDKSRDAASRHKSEKERLLALQDVLGTEAVQHKKHRVQFESRIKSRGEPAVWFVSFPPKVDNPLPAGILQECIIPRVLLSPTDALFAAKFFFFVHKIGTPNFPTLEVLDQFFRANQLLGTIYMCTEKEAKSLGVFMNEIFAELRRWHLKEDTYTIEGCGSMKNLPGFIDQYHKDGAKLLDWEEFRQRFTQWHLNAFNAVKSCLDSQEYMHRRNAFQVLKSVYIHFPLVNFHGKKIDAAIDNLIKSKSATEDIKTSGASILADIRKRAPTWIPMQMMRERDPTTGELEKEETPVVLAESTTANTVETTKPPLNAKAPEFKPTSSTTNGNKATTKTDAEDGEIEDGKEAEKTTGPMQGVVASSTPAHLRPDQQRPERSRTPDSNSKATPDPSTRQGSSRNDSRPTTPGGTGNPPPINSTSRGDLGRHSSQLPSLRPSANLPNRPEGPIPSDRLMSRAGSERAPERAPSYGRHEGRANEREQFGRLDRPGDAARDRELLRNTRREPSPGHRSRGRTPEASHPLPPDVRDRRDPVYGPPRDIREPQYPRDARDHRPLPRDLMRDGRPEPRPMDWEGSRGRGSSDPRGPPPTHYDDRGRPDPRSMEWEGPRGRGGPDTRGPPPSQYDDRNRPPMRPVNGPPRDQGQANVERPAHGRVGSPPPGPVVNSDRLALINEGLNQDRDQDRDRRDANRKAELTSRLEKEREAGRNQRSSKPSSRPQSPRRLDDNPPSRTEALPNDRRNDRGPPNADRNQPGAHLAGRDKRDGPPPAGPLTDQMNRGGAGRGRELIQPQAPARPPADLNHGRLNSQGFDPRTQDPNYGRLNAAPDAPSGPRGRGNMGGNMGRGARNFTAPQLAGGSRGMEPSSPAHIPPSPKQDRAPPSGPSSDRDRRDQRPAASSDQIQAPSSVPQGPAADQAGVHPSRLQQINPPTLQVNVPTGPASHGPPAASPFTPSGPRSGGHRQVPSVNNISIPASSPTSRNPPSGPASASSSRVKHDVRFEGMKNILKEAQLGGERGTSVRGRASNNRLNQQNADQSPTAEPGASDALQRADLMAAQNTSDPASDERSDSRGGGRRREGGGDRRRSHRSRSRSPRREAVENSTRQREDPPVRGPPEERRDRERRSEGGGSDRDDRGHRRGRGDREKDRDRGERERREPRGSGGREGGRNDEQPPRRDGPGQPVFDNRGPPPPPPPSAPPNGDMRGSRGGERHDRDRRESGRERKRNRGNGDEAGPMDSKRPRRNQ